MNLWLPSSLYHGGNGHCDRGSHAAVNNEVQVFIHCQDLFVCSCGSEYSFLPLCLPEFCYEEASYILHALPRQTS